MTAPRSVRVARRGRSAPPGKAAGEPESVEEALASLTRLQAGGQEALLALRDAVQSLETQFNRAGREQFRANTTAEARQKSLDRLLELQREAETYRERELAQLREQLFSARLEGRLEVMRRLLPALDGLTEALGSGGRILGRAAPVSRPVPFWRRLFGGEAEPEIPMLPAETLTAWLQGLAVVDERLLEALAAGGIRPIDTEGAAFDPHLHVAVETEPARGAGPNSIVREVRRGYVLGKEVVRYAEVVVARALRPNDHGQ